jgi:hypothetical protein
MLARTYPGTNANREVVVRPSGRMAGWSRASTVATLVGLLFALVGLILLIACTNLGSMLMARGVGRMPEMTTRLALGASRQRVVRQLLTESALLALTGGLLGLVIGFLGMRALLSVNTAGLPRLGDGGTLMGMDWRVVGFTLVLSLVTGIVFGLVPAVVSSRTDLNAVIKGSSSRSGSGLGQNKTRSALVVVELALCVVLLVGAALMIRTSLALGS